MKLFKLFSFLTVVFLITFIVLLGCEKQGPVVPVAEGNVNEVLTSNNLIQPNSSYGFKILRSKNLKFAKEFYSEALITPEGGSISVGDEEHGISTLRFRHGSVDQEVLVGFWWESTGFLEGGCEFSPHGITFNMPVDLILSYKDADLTGINEDNLSIYYYNEDTQTWERLCSKVNKNKKYVKACLEHFSRYAIGEVP